VRVYEVAFLIWFLMGCQFAYNHASGKELASIRNAWQRRCAMIVTFPAWIGLIVIMRSVEYVAFLFLDFKPTVKVFADSWNGTPQEPINPGSTAE
jgi:hypothetical protein